MTQTVLLGDEIELVGGGTPKTSVADYWGGNIPWLSVVDFGGDRRWVSGAEKKITKAGLQNSSTKLLQPGDIIISARGTVGELAQVKKPMAFNQSCYGVRAKSSLNQDYLYYLLKHSIADLQRQAHGGVFSTITRETFNHIKVTLPDLAVQKKIANILGVIDEKIELNRRMNETLEQMGQAFFRHYFIDNSEAEDWEDGTFASLGEVITGKTPSKANTEYYGKDMMFLKVPDMHGQSIIIKTEDMLSLHGADSQSKKYIPKWSTCVSCIATVGVVSLAGERLQTNQQINSIIPKSKEYTFFNYYLMKSKSELLKTMASGGSATPNLNKGHFESIRIKMPPVELLKRFKNETESLLDLVDENTQQIQTLTTLRDTLLPRLISGRIKVR